ncbi:hypothetical protein D0864_08767 [Hortaea werneckii]|uniref:GPI anchored serine-threonine rich protein n=1 Tax=Hortaea werneckii TaxID=91943 RepID=A0A3M7EUK4_HORWE|nr:hypothetical protein D0864_08767 [Hortaea werneckii]
MQYTTGLVLAVAGLAAAQSSSTAAAGVTSVTSASTSSSTSESGCGNIIQTCLGSTQAQLAACDATDWDCLCTQQTNVLTCYNNCPSDPNAFGAQQTKTSYCNAAKAYGSSSSSRTVSATASVSSSLSEAIASQSTALAAVTSDSTASSTADSTSSGSASGSAATASETDSGATAFAPAGGLIAAIFGLAALV